MRNKLLAILSSVMLSCLCLFTLTACDKPHEHSYTQVVTPPTCEAQGFTTNTCECGDVVVDNYVNALGHTFTTYTSDNNATCTANGTETAKCDNCDATDTREDADSKLPHSFTNYVSDNNATYDNDGTKTAVCDREGCEVTDTINDDGTKLINHISFKTFEVNGTVVYGGKVSNATNQFNFNDEIKVNGYATYVVALDEFGINQAYTKVVPLSVGNNVIYIFESVNNQITKTYEVTIRRRPMYNVYFNTLGSYVESQSIEEDSLATEPSVDPTRTGYTFSGWDYDFTTPITDYTTIYAKWTANTDTQYKVEYYLQNLNGYGYTIDNSLTENLTGTTDTTANAEIKEIEHFTAESETVSGNINGNGSTVLKVYYTRDTYTVTFDGNGGTLSSGIVSQTVKYGGSVTAPTFTKTGYTFTGYDKTNYDNISENFTATATWQINQYTVTIKYGNGKKDKVITQDYNTPIEDIENPERGGYTFNGWDKVIPTIMPAQNTTITAKWLAVFNHSNGEITSLTSHGKTLSEIVISNSIDGVKITSIGDKAFEDCDSLTSIVITDSVTSIGNYAFTGCDLLTKVNYLGTIDEWVQIEFYSSTSNPICYAHNLYINDLLATEAVLTSATKISSYAFGYCTSLTSVTIGNSVTSIGDSAFFNCDLLTNIVIPDSVTSIGYRAFDSCTSLTSVTIGNSVTSIGAQAFGSCTSLTSVTIGNSVTSIGDYAFSICYKLVEVINNSPNITVKKGSEGNGRLGCYALSVSNCDSSYVSKLSTDSNGYVIYTDGEDKILVGYVGEQTELTLPNDITKIYQYAFYNNGKITSVVIPNSVTSIGDYAFEDCDSLTSVTIGNSVTSIGFYAFYSCNSLTSIVIPDSVTSIGNYAFYDCKKLKSIKYRGSQSQWLAISKGYAWNYETGNYSITYNYDGD